jgi:hypothetical protein
MLDTQGFQPTDAETTIPDAAPIAPDAAPLSLPASLKAIADYEGLNYNTLRNNYFAPKIEPIYEGFECPALKSENGKFITEFGYQAIKRYVLKVINGKQDYSAYKAEVQAKLTPIAVDEPVAPKPASSALARRSSTLARHSYTQHDSSALVTEIEADVIELVATGESNFLLSREALVQRFEAMGKADAAIAYEAYQSGLQNTIAQLHGQTAKKQEIGEDS